MSHRLFLVEAEALTLNPNISEEVVKNAFEEAIRTSSSTGFLQDCAVTNERCGQFFSLKQDSEWARHYLYRAMQLYGDWGAVAKVTIMGTQYPILRSRRPFVLTNRPECGQEKGIRLM